ncbi:MAG: tRNA-guanine transglycosylase, partial [Elusimicrobia bacterium]|nr:tRNA-guanine transglycosylase [Elusimicrobiota bacterium]
LRDDWSLREARRASGTSRGPSTLHRVSGTNRDSRGVQRVGGAQRASPQPPLLFGILQGSVFPDLRREAAEHFCELPFDGAAIGGLSVGEPKQKTWEALETLLPELPPQTPRYLMGVGTPEDIWEAVERGVDMMDCVWPTRNARNGQVMTSQGKLYIKNAPYRKDHGPLDPACDCWVCRTYSRAYLSHLYRARELLSYRLLSFHNLHFLIGLMKNIKIAIESNRFEQEKRAFFNQYRMENKKVESTQDYLVA